MGKINKKSKKIAKNKEVLAEKSEAMESKNDNSDGVLNKSKNILPMKLEESPKVSKKNKTPKKSELKTFGAENLDLTKHDSNTVNVEKIESKSTELKSAEMSKEKKKNNKNLKKNKINKKLQIDKVKNDKNGIEEEQPKKEPSKITEEQPKKEPSKIKENQNSEKNERTIFIGNLPANIKQKQLENLLLPYGKLLKCRFRLPNMGKPILKHKMAVKAGVLNAYAELSSIEEAENALKLNGTDYKSHHLRVTKSTEKFNPNSINPEQVKSTVFIGNLKYSANDDALYNIFSSCGEIEYCRTLNNSKGCRGVAYVCFKNPHSVGLALELKGTLLEDRPITVSKYSLKNIKENQNKGNKEQPKANGFMRRVMKKFIKDEKVEPDTGLDNRRLFHKNKNLNDFGKNRKIKRQPKNKIEFRGVEVKSKKKFKSKPKNSKMLKDLANKIAPK